MDFELLLLQNGQWVKTAGIRRWISEKMFSDYHNQMEQLRETDDQIRDWTKDLDKLLKNAKAAQSRGKYLDIVFWLSEINKRLKLAVSRGQGVSDLQEQQIEELFGPNDESIMDDYFGEADPGKLVMAGLGDAITRRLAKWNIERLYHAKLRTQKLAAQNLMRLAETTMSQINSLLKQMGKARAGGSIAEYMAAITKIGVVQAKFENDFKNIFEKNFKEMAVRLRAKQQAMQAKQTQQDVESVIPPTLPGAPILPEAQIPATIKDPIVPDLLPQTVNEPEPREEPRVLPDLVQDAFETEQTLDNTMPSTEALPAEVKMPEISPNTTDINISVPAPAPEIKKPKRSRKKKTPVEEAALKTSNDKFYQMLEKAAGTETPFTLAMLMIKHSEAIEDLDENQSSELLVMAESILNG